jgi:FkbM family methyltransferase
LKIEYSKKLKKFLIKKYKNHMIKNILKNNKYIYLFYKRYLFPYFFKQEKEILFLRNFEFKTTVDIGANVGTYTAELQRNSKNVICFEPLKKNIHYLRYLLKKNVKIYDYALSNKNKFEYIYIPKVNFNYDYALATLNYKNIIKFKEFKRIKIKLKKFDKLFSNTYSFKDIDFIKIDVEGHELEVLKGMSKFLKKSKPIFLIEIEKGHNKNFNKVFSFFIKKKYKTYILKEKNNLNNINKKKFNKIINDKTYNNFFFISDL